MKNLAAFLILVIFLTTSYRDVKAQVLDDFSDDNFSANPIWQGDTDFFEIESGQLNSVGPNETSVLHLSTENSFLSKTTWEFLIDLQFSPSGSNKVRVYLASNQSDLEGNLNGYFIQIGQSGDDEIKLYRQDSDGSETLLFTGTSQLSGSVIARIQVERDDLGNWQINADTSGGSTFVSEGSPIFDATHTSTVYFGFVCFHTSSRKDLFYFDDISISAELAIDDVQAESETAVRVFYNQDVDQTSAELAANYSIDQGVTISSATRDATNPNEVVLEVSTLTTNSFLLSVENVADEFTLTPLAESATASFDYLELALESMQTLSATELELTFNDNLDEASAETLSNYSVDDGIGTPSAAELDDSEHNTVTLTFSEPFLPLTDYTLTYGSISNENLNSTLDAALTEEFEFVLPLVVETVEVVSKNTLELTFNLSLDENTAEAASNYSIDNDIGNPLSAQLDDANSAVVLLTLNSDLTENDYQITINNVEDEGNHPIEPESMVAFNYLPLAIESVSVVSTTQLEVVFNQQVEQTSAETAANYIVDFEIGAASAALRDVSDLDKVTLTFETELVNNDYQLTVNSVANISGNALAENLEQSFEHESQTPYRAIVVNEIFADPTPAIGLPEAEFVELLNISDKTINIGDFELSGGSVVDFALAPNSTIILAPSASASQYDAFGDVAAVTSWNTLTNSGEQIILRDNLGNAVDSLTYSTDWYGDDEKNDGGYSIEQINPNIACNYMGNWLASNDASGGTPGTQNSVFDNSPDISGPNLIEVLATDESTLLLTFDEPMDENLFVSASYSILSGMTSLGVNTIAPSAFSVEIGLETPLISGNIYEIDVTGVADCAGNAIDTNSFLLDYDVEAPVLNRIIISSLDQIELIFDEPLDESEAKTEDNYLTSNGLGNPDLAMLKDESDSIVLLTFESEFVFGQSNTLTIENLVDDHDNVLQSPIVTSFTYDQAIDTVVVFSINQIDISYDRAVDLASSTTAENYSIDEEIGHPSLVFVDENDASLFHLLFEKNIEDNKELTLTTRNILDDTDDYLPTPEYLFVYDTRAPKVNDVVVLDDRSLEVQFDEKVEKASAESIENYFYEDTFSSSRSLADNDSSVVLTFAEPFEREVTYELTIDHVKDISGNEIGSRIRKEFTYDIFPPELDSILVRSATELVLIFNETIDLTSAETVDNFVVGESVGSPASSTLDQELGNELHLGFDESFPELPTIPITISNLMDSRGNTLTAPIESDFDYSIFHISEVIALSENTVEVLYNKTPNSTTVVVESNYLLNDDLSPTIAEVDVANDQLLLLNFEIPFEDKSAHSLAINGVTDIGGNPMDVDSYSFEFDSKFKNLTLANNSTLELSFDVGMSQSSLPSNTDFVITPGNITPIAAILDEEDNSILRLVFTDEFEAEIEYTVSWPVLTNEFDNRIPAHYSIFSKDETAPTLVEAVPVSETAIDVVFSEALEAFTAEIASNYVLSPDQQQALSAEYFSDSHTVSLSFGDAFQDSQTYELSVTNVKDASGNLMEEASTSFVYFAPYVPSAGELLITEIMADATPSQGLPEAEYLEIYNRSEEEIVLSQIYLSDRTSKIALPDYTLESETYLILTSTSNSSSFATENSLGVSGFPSLGNSGDSLVLSLEDETVLDQVVYTDEWYRDESKKEGGYSLELLSFGEKCLPRLNWIASAHSDGGTPGTENSLFNTEPDQEAPKILEIDFISANTLQIIFNEAMDSESIQGGNYLFSEGISIGQAILASSLDTLEIQLVAAPEIGKMHSLEISNVTDCAGNLFAPYSFSFAEGKTPTPGDLTITEIMADPSPTQGLPDAEYLEIYNGTDDYIELSGLVLSDKTSQTQLDDYLFAPNSYLVLTSSSAAELYPSTEAFGISNFPSFGNSGDSLVLSLEDETVLDQVVYTDEWYRDESKKEGGYSLELLSFGEKCLPRLNWIASAHSDGGTPGAENSLFNTEPDQEAPEITSVAFPSESSLSLVFNEPMDTESIENGTYTFSAGLTVSELIFDEEAKTELTLILETAPTAGQLYTLSVSNVTDCAGNTLDPFSFDFGNGETPSFNDLIITEIMADPDPEVQLPQSEYLELYNASDKNIELDGLVLTDGSNSTTLSARLLPPDSYLLLTPSGSIDLFSEIEVLAVSGWPTLSNGGENLSIYSESDLVFSVSYDQDWYKDESKEDGGWSLEMIDISNPCGGLNNWTASLDPTGGTPGQVNSVATDNPDNLGPQLIEAIAQDNQNVTLIFDEKLNPIQYQNATFDFTPALTVAKDSLSTPESTHIFLTFNEELVAKTTYTITANLQTDCVGNFIREEANSVEFSLPEMGESGDILINEILFNPRSGGVDFVEIYNNSDKTINLKNWQLANYDSDGEIDPDPISTSDLIFLPQEFLVLTPDPVVLKADYPGGDESTFWSMSPFPAYSDSDGTVILLDASGNTIDLFDYDSDYHFQLLDDVNGVSLERIRFDGETNDPNLWKSAASTSGFATPGLMNSQFIDASAPVAELLIEPKVFIPDNNGTDDFATISYEVDTPGTFANVTVYDAYGRFIKNLAEGELISASGFFTWDGTDQNGSRARVGYYVIYFETFDADGNRNVIKETVVLGTRF